MHVVRSANVRYSKVRPLHPLCQFDVCRHEVRYGCQREDSCSFAHSVIELKCWVLQQDTGTEDKHLNYVYAFVQVVCVCLVEEFVEIRNWQNIFLDEKRMYLE